MLRVSVQGLHTKMGLWGRLSQFDFILLKEVGGPSLSEPGLWSPMWTKYITISHGRSRFPGGLPPVTCSLVTVDMTTAINLVVLQAMVLIRSGVPTHGNELRPVVENAGVSQF